MSTGNVYRSKGCFAIFQPLIGWISKKIIFVAQSLGLHACIIRFNYALETSETTSLLSRDFKVDETRFSTIVELLYYRFGS